MLEVGASLTLSFVYQYHR